uniref:Chitin-binding type-2 domain-containing protein n=1 Tax=Anopheles atroparvus TaxID=41427 RepID=A0A182IVK0_ANOAO
MVLVLGISLLASMVASVPEASNRCPSGSGVGQTDHLPHPTDCGRYLTCVGSTPVEQRCPAGLQWSEREATCVTPDEAQCSPAASQDGALSIVVAGKAVGKCAPQLSRCPVAAKPTEEVILIPHGDCRKFYACGPRGPIELSCPARLYWNHESCRCDYGPPSESNCGADKPQDPSEAHIRVRRQDEAEATTTEIPVQSGASLKGVSSVLVLIVTMVLNI